MRWYVIHPRPSASWPLRDLALEVRERLAAQATYSDGGARVLDIEGDAPRVGLVLGGEVDLLVTLRGASRIVETLGPGGLYVAGDVQAYAVRGAIVAHWDLPVWRATLADQPGAAELLLLERHAASRRPLLELLRADLLPLRDRVGRIFGVADLRAHLRQLRWTQERAARRVGCTRESLNAVMKG